MQAKDWLLKRVLVLIVGIAVLYQISVDHDLIKLKLLNQSIPPFQGLLTFAQDPKPREAGVLQAYVRYFKMTTEFLPDSPAPYALQGYCEYYLGHAGRAITLFRRAIELNPHVFMFHYNLGVIYFREGRDQEAQVSLQNALAEDMDKAIMFIHTSNIYNSLFAGVEWKPDGLRTSLQGAYNRTARMVALGLAKQSPSGEERTQYQLMIF